MKNRIVKSFGTILMCSLMFGCKKKEEKRMDGNKDIAIKNYADYKYFGLGQVKTTKKVNISNSGLRMKQQEIQCSYSSFLVSNDGETFSQPEFVYTDGDTQAVESDRRLAINRYYDFEKYAIIEFWEVDNNYNDDVFCNYYYGTTLGIGLYYDPYGDSSYYIFSKETGKLYSFSKLINNMLADDDRFYNGTFVHDCRIEMFPASNNKNDFFLKFRTGEDYYDYFIKTSIFEDRIEAKKFAKVSLFDKGMFVFDRFGNLMTNNRKLYSSSGEIIDIDIFWKGYTISELIEMSILSDNLIEELNAEGVERIDFEEFNFDGIANVFFIHTKDGYMYENEALYCWYLNENCQFDSFQKKVVNYSGSYGIDSLRTVGEKDNVKYVVGQFGKYDPNYYEWYETDIYLNKITYKDGFHYDIESIGHIYLCNDKNNIELTNDFEEDFYVGVEAADKLFLISKDNIITLNKNTGELVKENLDVKIDKKALIKVVEYNDGVICLESFIGFEEVRYYVNPMTKEITTQKIEMDTTVFVLYPIN